jgi:glutamate-1-semialdehyde 2,1-aminomutase
MEIINRILNEGYSDATRAIAAQNQYINIDDKWVIDTSMGAGTHIFGHGAANNIIKKAINNGSLLIVPNRVADECGELLYEVTGFNKFVFCNTGSEATLRSIRIARAYTGRDKIILFKGCWHGTHDWALTSYSRGIPCAVKDMVLILPLAKQSLERLQQRDIAMVMIEPIQSSLPIDQKAFLMQLREVCSKTGTVLCFDEVISGFRTALGGVSEYFNIVPDLVTYGKIIGGGLPIGIVGGNDVMDVIKIGVRMGGTFSANPLAVTACKSVIKSLIKTNPYKSLHKMVAKLSAVKSNTLQVITLGGMARLLFTTKHIKSIEERDNNELPKEKQQQILLNLRKRGIYVNSNNAIMLSTKHSGSNIKKILTCLEEVKA